MHDNAEKSHPTQHESARPTIAMNSESQASEPVGTTTAADKPTDASTSASAARATASDGPAAEPSAETQPTASEPTTTSTTEQTAPPAAPAVSPEVASTTATTTEAPASQSKTTATPSEPAATAATTENKDTPSSTTTTTTTEPKKSSPARMSLSFIQGDELKQPEVKDPAPTEGATPADTPFVAPNAAANAAANAADAQASSATDTTPAPAAESATSETTESAQESASAPAIASVSAPVDNADAAAVAADDDAPVRNPNEPKSLQKHVHAHPHSHKHHHHHHHHHRSFRNLKSKQDVNNKDVYSFVKATPFPKTDLGVLEYTTNLDTCLQGVLLPNLQLHVDCTVQVLIPRKHLRKETNLLVQRREIWGTDIYTDDSDIVSVLYHTGVLPTRAQVDAFYSALRAQEEGNADDTTDGHLEDEHPVTVGPNSHLVTSTSDNEQIYGDCLVTLRALPKLTEYTGCYRNGINSRSWKHHDGGSYAIQKVEFLRHDQAEYVLRRNKRSRLNTWSDQQKWAEWSSHKDVVLDFKDDHKGKKATVESLMS